MDSIREYKEGLEDAQKQYVYVGETDYGIAFSILFAYIASVSSIIDGQFPETGTWVYVEDRRITYRLSMSKREVE